MIRQTRANHGPVIRKYYSATQTDDGDLREGRQLNCEPTDTRHVLFASLERKNYFLIAVVVPFGIFEFQISFLLIVKTRTKRIKCVSQTSVIFSRSCPAMHVWREPHCVALATPYARCRPVSPASTMGLKPPCLRKTQSYTLEKPLNFLVKVGGFS